MNENIDSASLIERNWLYSMYGSVLSPALIWKETTIKTIYTRKSPVTFHEHDDEA
jgi:hypothetical protein